jgi:hypothetical protein
MNHKSRVHSISWFQNHYREGRLELRPPFQRKPVWGDKQRSFLIESILMDIPIPEVYVQVTTSETGEENFGVVDGQQRLRTILQFVGLEREEDRVDDEDRNAFQLDSLPKTSAFKGMLFGELSSEQRKNFFNYEICVRYLITEHISEVEDVFKRLNKYTLPLKAQELRNATYHGPFAKLSEKLANNEYWAVNRIVSPAAIRRMADIEMMSDLLIGLQHQPQGGSGKVIDEYYEQYEQYDDEFPDQSRITKLFEDTLAIIQRLFPQISDAGRWGNRADFYSLFTALGNSVEHRRLLRKSEKQLAARLIEFGEEVDERLKKPTAKTSKASQTYARAIEKGSNDKARRMDRYESLLEIIEPFLEKKK